MADPSNRVVYTNYSKISNQLAKPTRPSTMHKAAKTERGKLREYEDLHFNDTSEFETHSAT